MLKFTQVFLVDINKEPDRFGTPDYKFVSGNGIKSALFKLDKTIWDYTKLPIKRIRMYIKAIRKAYKSPSSIITLNFNPGTSLKGIRVTDKYVIVYNIISLKNKKEDSNIEK